MSEAIDETGNRYGRLAVMCMEGRDHFGRIAFKCLCDCGKQVLVAGQSLRSGDTKSCGCLYMPDETGKRYGKLTAIKRTGKTKSGGYLWLCHCDCGNETVKAGSDLRSGHTKSCGCLPGGGPRLPKGVAAFGKMYRNMQNGAKKRGYEWDLTKEQVAEITQENCFYCGASPKNKVNGKGYNGSYSYSGIDRVNNKIGYIYGNVVPCCKICNQAKNKMTAPEFLEWIERVADHQQKKRRLISLPINHITTRDIKDIALVAAGGAG